jgi:hypothetical protein
MKSNKYYDNLFKKILNETLESKADELMEKITNPTPAPTEFDYVAEGETCECGGEMYEGECMECGKSYMMGEEEEMGEGNAFSGALNKAKKEGKKSFEVDGETYPVKEDVLYELEYLNETELFTEDEIIDMIEKIIKEEDNIKKGKTPAGYVAYEKSHKGSGKEEEDYIKALEKKMKDYLKDGSKGEYNESPKHFPKGNGELAKMDKMAYEISTDGEEFLDDYMRPGMENLDYDEIHPNEDWMKDNIEGSSRTGNNPEWANADETDLGKKINKKRKENKFAKAKRKSYNKSPQPVVSDKPGQETGTGLHINVESVNEKEVKKLNEEFDRIKNLMNYNGKTQ